MIPERDQPKPEAQKAIPQTDAREVSGERRAQGYTDPPKFDGRGEGGVKPVPKPKSWLLPVIVALVILGGLAGVTMVNHSSGGSSSSPTAALAQSENVLTVTGADVDQGATDEAISALKSGTAGPLLAALPEQVKQEILAGERKFYRIPPTMPVGGTAFQSGDRISVDFNGTPYGTYDLSQPVTLNMPLKLGDQVAIHCLSVAQGKTSLIVDMATVLNPIRSESLAAGQTQILHVKSGNSGENYEWFQQQAQAGNVVAEYGLGHMYQYGLGVPQDSGQAIHWYQQAAGQNYLDAKEQLQLLQANP